MGTQLADYRPRLVIFDISDPYNINIQSEVRFGGRYPSTTAWGSDINSGTYRVVVDDVHNCDADSVRRLYDVSLGGSESYIAADPSIGRESMELIIHDFDTGNEVILSDWVNILPIVNHHTGVISGYTGNMVDMNAGVATQDGHYIFAGGGFPGYIGESGGTWSFYVDDEYNPIQLAGGSLEGWFQGWSTMAPVDYAINGSYMYLISHYDDEFFDFPESHGFNIVHINDKENPQLIKWVNKPLDSDVDEPDQVKVHNGYAYVTCNGSSKLLVYDVQEFFENSVDWPEGILFSTQAQVGDGYYLYRHPFDTVHYTTGIFGDDEIIKPSPDQTTWALPDYSHRQKIVVNSTSLDTTVSGFPTGISVGLDNPVFDTAQADGHDIRFTRVNGDNVPYQRTYYDAGEEIAAFYMVLDLEADEDQTLYMYYGYGAAGNSSTIGIFDGVDYNLVYTFDDGPYDGTPGEIDDITAYTNTARRANGTWQPIAGDLGYQASLRDGYDKIYLDSDLAVGTSWTISFSMDWPKIGAGSTFWYMFAKGVNRYHATIRKADNLLGVYDGGFRSSGFDMDTLESGRYHMAVVGKVTGGTDFYINGELVGNSTYRVAEDISAIGCSTSSDMVLEDFDEYRVAGGERPASWLMAEYQSIANHDNFITFGSENAQTTEHLCIETYLYWTGTIYPELVSTTGVTANIIEEQGAPTATITEFTTSSITFRTTCADLDWGNGYQVRITEDSSGFSVYGITITVAKSKECNDENRYLCNSEELCNATSGVWWNDWYGNGWCFDP